MSFDQIARGLPAQLSGRDLDWLETLGHLFAVDLACDRGAGDQAWARRIEAWIPVRDPAYWQTHVPALQEIFAELTSDHLTLHFEEESNPAAAPRQSSHPFPEHDAVLLVSGGTDSFVGASEHIRSGRTPLLLSHTASGATNTAQAEVEQLLQQRSPGLARPRISVGKARNAPFPGSESSQRARTLLFIGCAALLAAKGGSNEVQLNENGIMALHLPLTAARIGSYSTHTASPPIVERVRRLANAVLDSGIAVTNTLVGLTKPEVVGLAKTGGYINSIERTVSCWSIGRTREHCGICVPCLIRRISSLTHGAPDVPYTVDVLTDRSVAAKDPRAMDNLVHLITFVEEIGGLSDLELQLEYPELLNGSPALTLGEAIDLHRRWAIQASDVLFGFPVPQGLR